MTTVVVATGNPGKLAELKDYLEELDWTLALKPKEIEVEETGTTFLENARLKASEVAIATNSWAIADDSGLSVVALGGAPGVYSSRYGDSDASRINRVLRELGDETDRRAEFVCAIALSKPDGTIVIETEGCCPGSILTAGQGAGGFGYDPIFFVTSRGKTFAQMSNTEKERFSHRGIAFDQLMPALRQLKFEEYESA
ncbi:RdgB/HAM1 family non-canonical purine NTP pyrophosphatase [cf. Phormidesmis sp. LEGE 11477]|uniref:RdgB/HAM1 family non-canonical purine NTP pyrophosphatase n=1 Tax=cf. Phormidesmis sp. LEGE 11477 TaxID=1828680 RepID=UPI001880D422|nr:RdgB/HAM1 family non-canonical purine NTP pyrophosphatase [cf. Phormidesmis sp. LEGE 11477]MBE9064654.1 RdgB/HAM1 family non-canonical purine NTP pyrophosphatase [cf. Phormidesmis sp. LEGE 11477]